MNTILVTGAHGQIAFDLKQQATAKQIPIIALAHQELDITSLTTIEKMIICYQPKFIINTAAYTDVEGAEVNQTSAWQTNTKGPELLAIACQQYQIPLIHLSTDYVFDGIHQETYAENDLTNPLNYYGHTKRLGEQAIQQHCEKYIILRVSGVFGVHGKNFVKTMLQLGSNREILRVVSDQFTCPTPSENIAETLLTIINYISTASIQLGKNLWGTYHYCAQPITSWYNFAQRIFNIAKQYHSLKVTQLLPIPSAEYTTAAQRPPHAILNCQKIFQTFGIIQPFWEESLSKLIKNY